MLKHRTKNLFVPVPETTISGVTLSHADDGSFLLNGTATQDRYIYAIASIKAGSYLLCSVDSDVSDTTEVRLRDSGTAIAQFTLGAQSRSVSFTVSEDIAELQYAIRMGSGTVYDNFKIKPMLFKDASTAPSSYVPYLNTPPEMYIATENLMATEKNATITTSGVTAVTDDTGKISISTATATGNYIYFICSGEELRAATSVSTFASEVANDAVIIKAGETSTISVFTEDEYSTLYIAYADGTWIGISSSRMPYTSTTDKDIIGFGLQFRLSAIASPSGDFELMLVKGSTAPSSYIPYGYHYIGEMYKKSVNLYNVDETAIGSLSDLLAITKPTRSKANVAAASTVGTVIDFHALPNGIAIPCSQGDSFSWKEQNTPSSARRVYTELDANGLILFTRLFYTASGLSYTVTNASCAYLLIEWSLDETDISQMVVVKGSTIPTKYEPYGYSHVFSAGYDTTVTGNPATMSNARAKSLAYELSGNSKRTIEIDGTEYDVPDGYTLLDSLQFTAATHSKGTYINTGILPNNATKVEVKANWTTASGSDPTLYGARSSGTYYELLTSYLPSTSYYQYGGQSEVINLSSYFNTNTIYLTDNKYVYANGTLLSTLSEATFNITNPIYLGCLNESGTADRFTNAEVFYFKIYQDGTTLSFAGVPAKRNSDSVLGMYDFITNTFFTNAGSGSFTAGSELPLPTSTLGVKGVGDISKNLFDIATIKDGYFIRAGNTSTENPLGSEGTSSSWSCSDYIPVSPSTTYTVTYPYYQSATAAGLVCFTDKTVASAISGVTTNAQGSTVYTFTTPATCNYVRFSWNHTQGNNCQLEVGSSSTTIVPHYQFPLVHAQNCGMVDLGTLTWVLNSGWAGYTYYANVTNMLQPSSASERITGIFSSNYSISSTTGASTLENKTILRYSSSVSGRIIIRDDTYTNVTDFREGVSGVYLYYQRITDDTWQSPTTYTIYDDSQLMKVGTYVDTIESDGTRTNNIKKVTLSAGTTTLSDAMTNSPYICTQQADGTLSGQSITLDTGVSDADVYYVLATGTEETITTPSISTVAGTNYLECTTTLLPSELEATYRKKTK